MQYNIRQNNKTSKHENKKNKKEKNRVRNHRLAISQVFAMSQQHLAESLMLFTEGLPVARNT
jgi:hypothetical protein